MLPDEEFRADATLHAVMVERVTDTRLAREFAELGGQLYSVNWRRSGSSSQLRCLSSTQDVSLQEQEHVRHANLSSTGLREARQSTKMLQLLVHDHGSVKRALSLQFHAQSSK